MNLLLYNEELQFIANIGDQYISCLWSEGYQTTETFTLELGETELWKNLIRPDMFIYRQDRRTIAIIISVNFQKNKVVVSGKQCTHLLNDVAFIGKLEGDEFSIESLVITAYDMSSKHHLISSIRGDNASSEIYYPYQVSNKDVLSIARVACEYGDVGLSSTYVRTGIRINLYKPEENENLIFSSRLGNVNDPSILMSVDNYKNFAYVLGEGEGENRTIVTVDHTNGDYRREIIIDARDIQKNDEETEDSYRNRLYARGVEKLNEHQKILKTSFSAFASDFGTRFDLGDVLTVDFPDFNVRLKARVTRFIEKNQNNNRTISIDVGKISMWRT